MALPTPQVGIPPKKRTAFTPEQLAAQQKKISAGLQGIAGVGALMAQNATMQEQANQIQTNAPAEQEDAYGRPTYNLGTFEQATSAIKPQGAQGDEIINGVASGAQTGAALGSFIPGGAFIGAGIGALAGGLSSIFGGNARKTQEEQKKRLAEANLRLAQGKFNNSMIQFNNQQAAQNRYNDLANTDQRMQNIYSYNTQYQS